VHFQPLEHGPLISFRVSFLSPFRGSSMAEQAAVNR
jgi:hypothetical protein